MLIDEFDQYEITLKHEKVLVQEVLIQVEKPIKAKYMVMQPVRAKEKREIVEMLCQKLIEFVEAN